MSASTGRRGWARLFLGVVGRGAGDHPPPEAGEAPGAGAPPAELDEVIERELDHVHAHRHPFRDREQVRRSLVGIALSGGGIRSATTNLGILQALARMEILPMVDYVSTVSGGGYIGACLSSLLSWNGTTPTDPLDTRGPYTFAPRESPRFTTDWKSFPFRAELLPKRQRPVGTEVVGHLRTHGTFLIARWGVLRRETMRSIGTLVSGVVYNLALFLLTVFVASGLYVSSVRLMAPSADSVLGDARVRAPVPDTVLQENIRRDTARAPVPVGSVITRTATAECEPGDPGCVATQRTTLRPPALLDRVARNARVVGVAFQEAWREGTGGGPVPRPQQPLALALAAGMLVAGLAFLTLTGAVPSRGLIRPSVGESEEDAFERRLLRTWGWITVATAVAASALLPWGWRSPEPSAADLVFLFVPLAVFGGARLLSFLLAVLLLPRLPAWSRRARSLWGAYQAITMYGLWAAVAFAVLPLFIYALADQSGRLSLGVLGSLLAARMLTSRRGPGRRVVLPHRLRNILLGFAVAAVLLLLVLLFGALLVRNTDLVAGVTWTGAILLLIVGFAFGVDQNRIGPHYFYRDRLAETYLLSEFPDTEGRLRLFRNAMEMPLAALHGIPASGPRGWRNTAPYHLISAAINLAGSRDLTRKDRKSGYWLFSKLYCGSTHTRFRRTEEYREGKTKLARAITISGAAASSALGRDTFFAQAFATTIFNVRLGYWLENPKYPESRTGKEGGVFWPAYLWREVTTNTTEDSRLVNLSDGGHTGDNVGIYPLLQRKCKIIIACDAERDPDLSFGSFTEALRQAYVDLGVDVDIDLSMIRPDPDTGRSRSHCAVGRIRYPDRPDQESYLIYLKNSLTGDEPAPVLNYRSDNPAFPHESTADQFFDDAQFESYRALGVHLAEHTFGRWIVSRWFPIARAVHRGEDPDQTSSADWPEEAKEEAWRWRFGDSALPSPRPERGSPEGTFADELLLGTAWLRLQILHTPFRATEQSEYWRLTERLQELERLFLDRGAPDDPPSERSSVLERYYRECFAPEGPAVPSGESTTNVGPEPTPEIRHVVAIQAQFMEDVYYVLRLDRYANAPDNRGWMNLFRRWGRSPTFNRVLDQIRATLALDFLEFYDLYLRCFPARIDEAPVPHPWDLHRRREDPRSEGALPPARTGGEPVEGTAPPRAAAASTLQPEPHQLPGIFLDPGIREVTRSSGERPTDSTSRSASESSQLPGGHPGSPSGTDAGDSSSGTPNE